MRREGYSPAGLRLRTCGRWGKDDLRQTTERRRQPTGRDRQTCQLNGNVDPLSARVTGESLAAMTATEVEHQLAALAARAATGDPVSQDALLAHLRPLVLRYCRARLSRNGSSSYGEADDVAQEVCYAVLTALPRYRDVGRPFMAFVFGIAAHKVADAHRSASRDMSR